MMTSDEVKIRAWLKEWNGRLINNALPIPSFGHFVLQKTHQEDIYKLRLARAKLDYKKFSEEFIQGINWSVKKLEALKPTMEAERKGRNVSRCCTPGPCNSKKETKK